MIIKKETEKGEELEMTSWELAALINSMSDKDLDHLMFKVRWDDGERQNSK